MLQLKNINYILENEQGSLPILQDINLTLKRGKLYVITGPNGSGKSSLAKLIMGIYQPTSGQIFWQGEKITSLGITERARLGIGYAFQQPPRFKGITIGELLNLSSKQNCGGFSCNYLFDVGLCPKDYMRREVNADLSGGELKRVEIASLLSRQCQLAIFDEPEAGIDLWSFERLAAIFKKMKQKKDVSIVIISHQERILQLADEIILLTAGRIEEQGSRDELLDKLALWYTCWQDCGERIGE